jgi:hypothetical protein
VIARVWSGVVRREDGDACAAHMLDTGLAEYAATPGNRGAWILRRDHSGRTEFVALSLWESPDAIGRSPEDGPYLIECGASVAHYDVAGTHNPTEDKR